jgi:hypothetical protein
MKRCSPYSLMVLLLFLAIVAALTEHPIPAVGCLFLASWIACKIGNAEQIALKDRLETLGRLSEK